jgi:hypothetical protein
LPSRAAIQLIFRSDEFGAREPRGSAFGVVAGVCEYLKACAEGLDPWVATPRGNRFGNTRQ